MKQDIFSTFRRFLGALLCATMLLSVIPAPIGAVEPAAASDLNTVTITGRAFPQNDLAVGADFLLKGTITAQNPIVSITASILTADAVEQQVSIGFEGVTSYTLDGSELDQEISFAALGEGAYTFRLTVLEEEVSTEACWTSAFTVGANHCAHVYVCEQLSQVSCEEPGVNRYSCCECGNYYDELTDPLGHDYQKQTIPATCMDYEKVSCLCSRCGDCFVDYADGVCTDWSESKPSGVEDARVQTRNQYRYSEYETTTTSESLPGWELLGSQWEPTGSGSVQYVANWPAGFSTEHSLYISHANTPVAAEETDTAKTTIDVDMVTGYLYYHWCGTTVSDTMGDDCKEFHAFFSPTEPTLDGTVSDSPCANFDRYYHVAVNTQTYTTYEKVYAFGRWTDWSEWSEEACEADEACKVESRTLYRAITAQLGSHSWEAGVCTLCGVSETAPTLQGTGFTLSFEDEILVNFYFTVSDASLAEQRMLVFHENPGTADIAKADAVYDAAYVPSSGYYIATTDRIAAKEMGDDRYYCACAKYPDGTYAYSPLYQYSPKKYAMSRLEKSNDETLKALCVAMLDYGAAAQEYFGYRTEELMNAALTEAQRSLVEPYCADFFTGPVRADTAKIGVFARTEPGFSQIFATVSFDGALAINYYFLPDAQMDEGITFYYWSSDDYAAAQTLTADNATGVLPMVNMADGSYWAQVSGIAAKAVDDTYYVAAVYTSGGTVCCSGVIAYSLSKYYVNHAKDGDPMAPLAAAAAMYGCYAKAYFGGSMTYARAICAETAVCYAVEAAAILDKTDITIVLGDTAQITVLQPQSKALWTSGNNRVATAMALNQEVVELKGEKCGTAVITCRLSDGTTATCRVTVVKSLEEEIPVQPAYFAPCAASVTSLTGALSAQNYDTSTETLTEIAAANGISDYTGTTAQNEQLLNLMKAGKLINPGLFSHISYYPVCDASLESITDALESIGVDGSFTYREKIAAANGITDYSGTADQNIQLLDLLKSGKLRKPDAAADDFCATVTFLPNGGTGTMEAIQLEEGITEVTLSPNAFSLKGYTFQGWSSAADGEVLYADGDTIAIYGDVTLYAQWAPNQYTVVYDPNGGSGTMEDTPVTYGVKTQLRTSTFTREGYTQIGWYRYRSHNDQWSYVSADGATRGWYQEGSEPSGYTKHVLTLDTTVSTTTSIDGDTVILYAVWQENTGKVSLDGKKVLFIGNSFIYYGGVVQYGNQRSTDKGWFKQICTANGENCTVYDCTYGNHHLYDFTSSGCESGSCHDGADLLKGVPLSSIDYVFISESGNNNANFVKDVKNIMKRFPSTTQFFYLSHSYTYIQNHTKIINNLDNIEALGVGIIEWGKLVDDVIDGRTKVPGATVTYKKTTFIKNKGDTHHPNPLSGYITAQMAYCAVTGNTAVGQVPDLYAIGDTIKYKGQLGYAAFISTHYTSSSSTNFKTVMKSKKDMQGLQELMDKYLAQWGLGVNG